MRIAGFAFLLLSGMMAAAAPGYAGFEYTPSVNATPAAPVVTPEPVIQEAPMPVVSAPPVEAEPLNNTARNMAQPRTPSSVEPVYVRRQRDTIPLKAPKDQPMDTEALLEATENGDPLALTPEGIKNAPVRNTGRLVINPYPLDSEAKHNDSAAVSVEQAMMEQGGNLRPVATPGQRSTQGMLTRARMSGRYSDDAGYLDRSGMTKEASASSEGLLDSMTPMPEGEGPSLKKVESQPLPPYPARKPAQVSAHAAPREDYAASAQSSAQDTAGQYAEAVGFGRDLPLALALSQVVPAQYSYSFAKDVNVGTTVSWQGGKPWNMVLDDMLSQKGLRAVIQDNQVTIVKAS
jgi:hypothetical protein